MRIRRFAALSAAALTAVLLAGCSSADAPEGEGASPSPTVADLCAAQAAPGEASDAVTVEGEFGSPATATFTAPLEYDDLQVTVVEEGKGDPVEAGQLVTYALTAFNPETGETLGNVGHEDSPLLPAQISADNPLGQLFGCLPTGTRVVATFPASDQAAGEVYVADLLSVVPTAAWGEPQEPADGLPTVELGEDGSPTITVPEDMKVPDTTALAVLKKGDGATVAKGDTVLVQYTGVLTDGTVFDSSWKNGAPAQFQTTGVVAGFGKALEGQTVGSQVLAVIPAAEGYGDQAQGSIPANSTLIFVVDILGVQPAAPAQ